VTKIALIESVFFVKQVQNTEFETLFNVLAAGERNASDENVELFTRHDFVRFFLHLIGTRGAVANQ